MKRILILLAPMLLAGCGLDSITSLVGLTSADVKLKPESCWTQDAKDHFQSMTLREVNATMKAAYQARKSDQPPDESELAALEKGTTVTLDTFHAISQEVGTGALQCGANAKLVITVGEHTVSNEANVALNIYKGEMGVVYAVQKAGIVALTNTIP